LRGEAIHVVCERAEVAQHSDIAGFHNADRSQEMEDVGFGRRLSLILLFLLHHVSLYEVERVGRGILVRNWVGFKTLEILGCPLFSRLTALPRKCQLIFLKASCSVESAECAECGGYLEQSFV